MMKNRGLDMKLSRVLSVVLCLAVTGTALGQRRQLSVGDQAPGLDIETWVAGAEVAIKPGNVYLVLFFDSLSSIGNDSRGNERAFPSLAKLYVEYSNQGLVVVVISPESSDRLASYVKQQRDFLGFTVATDRRSATRRAWVDQAQVSQLPVGFIVGLEGRIMFIGHPADAEFAGVLEKVIRGRYDPALFEQAAPMLAAARRARTVKNWRMASRHFDEVIGLNGRVFAEVALERFEMMIVDMKDPAAAYRYAESELIGKLLGKDADAMRLLAHKITLDAKIKKEHRDLEVAEKAAARALKISGSDDPRSLATMALVHFHQGRVDAAIDLQAQAYFVAQPRKKSDYKRVLNSYRNAVARLPGSE